MRLIAKNMAALLGSQLATWAVSLVMIVVMPQRLGDVQFGRISFAFAFVGFFGLLAGLGMSQFITKQVARDTSRTGYYVFNALVMSAVLVVVLSVAAIATASLMHYPVQTRLLIGAACLGMGFNGLIAPLVAGLQGEQRMGKTAIWSIVDKYASNGLLLAVLAARKNLFTVALAMASTGAISLLANGALLFRQMRESARLDLGLWKELVRGGFPFLVWNVALTIYGTIDTPILSMMAGDATVGWYTLAYRLIGVPAFFASIVVTASYPALSEHGLHASPFFANLANRTLRLVFLAGAPIAAGTALVAGDVIGLLHYPAGFSHAIPLMRILALHVPVVGITMVLGTCLIACDRQKEWVKVAILAAVLNPLINLAAIPAAVRMFGDGAVGAAIVTVATELFMLGGAVYLRPAGVLDRLTLGFLFRCTLAALLMVAVVMVAGSPGLVVKVILGAATYGVASILLRTVSIGETYRLSLQLINRSRPHSASSTS